MLCVFFLCLYTRTCRNNASISNCKGSFLTGKNQKKIKEKQEFLRKTSFQPNRFFYMVVIQKLIIINTSNFHQMFIVD
ncbi:Uncharacterized protein FWK35_00034777, partial [Aphis craccivora]